MEDDVSESPGKVSRRLVIIKFLGASIVVPALVAVIPTTIGYYLTRRDLVSHRLSARIYYSDNAIPETKELLTEIQLIGLADPEVTPGVPATEFNYIVAIENVGDYPEENVVARVNYVSSGKKLMPISGFTLSSTSTLLLESVTIEQFPDADGGFQLTIPRLNPRESVTQSSSWHQPVEVRVEARSDDVSSFDVRELD